MSFILLDEGAVDSIKGVSDCASNKLAYIVFLTLLSFTDAADISAAFSLDVALEDICII